MTERIKTVQPRSRFDAISEVVAVLQEAKTDNPKLTKEAKKVLTQAQKSFKEKASGKSKGK